MIKYKFGGQSMPDVCLLNLLVNHGVDDADAAVNAE